MARAPEIRELHLDDVDEMSNVLHEGFPRHSVQFWRDRLGVLAARNRPVGAQLFGYGVECEGLQGVALAIGANQGPPDESQLVVNISSWTVRPAYRGPIAKELYRRATEVEGVRYSNLSAAPHTQKTIKAFGFKERTAGQTLGVGTSRATGARRRVMTLRDAGSSGLPAQVIEMLHDHEARGCFVLLLDTPRGPTPFVFLPRRIKPGIPVAQLIYCQREADFLENSLLITMQAMKRGFVALLIDSSGAVKGVTGRYVPQRAAKYYKGPEQRYAVDHTYSEMIYVGF
jgi:hypothetical protein